MISSLTSSNESITIKANSTEYLATIHFINDKGQTKIIPGRDFIKLTFESILLNVLFREETLPSI